MRASPSCTPLVFYLSSRSECLARYTKLFVVLALVCAMTSAPVSAQTAGQNVNMVSGTGWTNGDPFLERQNEPSIAVSTRNSSHLFGASNDYRSVDLPGLLGIDERGDAWLGVYKSFDGGLTWQSTLLPGFPLDASPEGTASPIHGRQAAADPLVRALHCNAAVQFTVANLIDGTHSTFAELFQDFVAASDHTPRSKGCR